MLSLGQGGPGYPGAYLDPESLFLGYFRCTNRCRPGGFPLHFGEVMGIDPQKVPGYDPDREPYARDISCPPKNMNHEVKRFVTLMGEEAAAYFREFGVSKATLDEMRIGYNGRYIVYPYYLEDGNCYACRCVLPGREEDHFWHGDEDFFADEFHVCNVQEIERCADGALFVTEGEKNLLALKELGFPGIAVPTFAVLETLQAGRFAQVRHMLLVMSHSPEASLAVREFAKMIRQG
ncbi:MAG: hypothetical protein ABIG67_05915 [Pseudomonadota bacterium]